MVKRAEVIRRKILQSLYLEPEKTEMLDELARMTRVPKAVLLREAVDDLLAKYQWIRNRQPDGKGNIHTLVRRPPKK
jgi:hypothetical protein